MGGICERIYNAIHVENLDASKITVPDAQSIEEQAFYYFEKYGIIIRLANDKALLSVVDELNEKINPLSILELLLRSMI